MQRNFPSTSTSVPTMPTLADTQLQRLTSTKHQDHSLPPISHPRYSRSGSRHDHRSGLTKNPKLFKSWFCIFRETNGHKAASTPLWQITPTPHQSQAPCRKLEPRRSAYTHSLDHPGRVTSSYNDHLWLKPVKPTWHLPGSTKYMPNITKNLFKFRRVR